jgi:hypothetical protein
MRSTPALSGPGQRGSRVRMPSVMCVRSLLPKSYVPADRIAQAFVVPLSGRAEASGRVAEPRARGPSGQGPGVASEARSVQSAERERGRGDDRLGVPCARDVVGWGWVRGTSAFFLLRTPFP